MTPKEKAEELVNNFLETIPFADTNVYKDWKKEMKNKAKECALIAVNDIIEGIERAFDEYEKGTGIYVKNRIFYWDFYSDVKQQIEKL